MSGRKIYIVTNPNYIGWIKLGVTFDVPGRIASFNVACPDKAFKLAYSAPCRLSTVRDITKSLKLASIEKRGEWYKTSVPEMIAVIEGINCLAVAA